SAEFGSAVEVDDPAPRAGDSSPGCMRADSLAVIGGLRQLDSLSAPQRYFHTRRSSIRFAPSPIVPGATSWTSPLTLSASLSESPRRDTSALRSATSWLSSTR